MLIATAKDRVVDLGSCMIYGRVTISSNPILNFIFLSG